MADSGVETNKSVRSVGLDSSTNKIVTENVLWKVIGIIVGIAATAIMGLLVHIWQNTTSDIQSNRFSIVDVSKDVSNVDKKVIRLVEKAKITKEWEGKTDETLEKIKESLGELKDLYHSMDKNQPKKTK